ncbi:MAG: hypothetical protein U9Q68_09460 [Euryarchaeota archaeon]|nr:hypothetical protein [Euryarchaeota archaeon]
MVNAPLEIVDATLRTVRRLHVSRYPDVSDELPFEIYNESTAEIKLVRSKEVLAWVKTQMGEDDD